MENGIRDPRAIRDQADKRIKLTTIGSEVISNSAFDEGFALNIHAYDDPEFAWAVIQEIVGRFDAHNIQSSENNDTMMILSNLGSGPLETLIAQNGVIVMSRIIDAVRDDRFRYALESVWQNSMSEEHWLTIQKLTGRL